MECTRCDIVTGDPSTSAKESEFAPNGSLKVKKLYSFNGVLFNFLGLIPKWSKTLHMSGIDSWISSSNRNVGCDRLAVVVGLCPASCVETTEGKNLLLSFGWGVGIVATGVRTVEYLVNGESVGLGGGEREEGVWVLGLGADERYRSREGNEGEGGDGRFFI